MIRSLPVAALLCLGLSSCVIVPIPHTSPNAYQFSGRVRDSLTRKAVPGATVVLVGLPDTTTHSDAEGYFITRSSYTVHFLGIYPYDDAFVVQIPPHRSTTGPIRVTHPNYKTRELPVYSDEHYDPFGPKATPVRLNDIFIERLSAK